MHVTKIHYLHWSIWNDTQIQIRPEAHQTADWIWNATVRANATHTHTYTHTPPPEPTELWLLQWASSNNYYQRYIYLMLFCMRWLLQCSSVLKSIFLGYGVCGFRECGWHDAASVATYTALYVHCSSLMHLPRVNAVALHSVITCAVSFPSFTSVA